MRLTPEKRAFLVDKLGEERVKAIEDELGTLSEDLVQAGVDYKGSGKAEGYGEALLRLAVAYKKVEEPAPDPYIAPYIDQLRRRRPALSEGQKAALAELEAGGGAGKYVSDLLQGRTVQGG